MGAVNTVLQVSEEPLVSHEIDPDKHWREVRGCEGHGHMAPIALRFVTAGPSEAEVEIVLRVEGTSREFMGRTTEWIGSRLAQFSTRSDHHEYIS
jgi:hypothetical protein